VVRAVAKVAAQQLAHLFGILVLGEAGEPHQVSEQDRYQPALRQAIIPGRGLVAASLSAALHSPQNFSPASYGVPQLGQPVLSRLPHSTQNLRPAWFSMSQRAQRISSLLYRTAKVPHARDAPRGR
jgi:hypothetical protein